MTEAPESTRVIFTFDKDSLDAMRNMQAKLGFKSLAETVRESLRLANALQEQAEEGFSNVILRDKAGRERKLVIDFLTKLNAK
jgi:hypothetical protein